MEPQESQPSSQRSPIRATFSLLPIALIIAILLATLFTAWTPGESQVNIASSGPRKPVVAPTPNQTATTGPTPTTRTKPLVGIVSGHWGNDSGATCDDGLTEAEINQAIAVLAQKELVAQGYDAEILKEFDGHLIDYEASALVSIHADSCDYINDQATGYKVAAALAGPNPENSTRLTSCLRGRYGQITGLPLHSTSVTPDMSYYHAFEEIDKNTPAAIIEVGFLNLDRQFLTENPDRAASGIVSGILCFLRNESITIPTDQPNS